MGEQLADWIGRSEDSRDVLDAARANAVLAAIAAPATLAPGDPLPPLCHWLHFWNVQPPAALGADGHPAKGGFLPPVPLPRRMWAGGRVQFVAPLAIGEAVTRRSTITGVEAKSGKSGELVFVTVLHEISNRAGLAVREEQDLVYRGAAAPGSVAAPQPAPAPGAAWRETIDPDPVLLFRYSALTMNGHRIHYDRDYATGEEAYPGLVIHGPLQATLLARLAAERLGRSLSRFDFRGQSPAFDGLPLYLCGEPENDGAALWTEQGGRKCMVATAS